MKSSRPCLCSWEANPAQVESGGVGGASRHHRLAVGSCQDTDRSPHLCLCLFLYSARIPKPEGLTGWSKAVQKGQGGPIQPTVSSPFPQPHRKDLDGFPTTLRRDEPKPSAPTAQPASVLPTQPPGERGYGEVLLKSSHVTVSVP